MPEVQGGEARTNFVDALDEVRWKVETLVGYFMLIHHPRWFMCVLYPEDMWRR